MNILGIETSCDETAAAVVKKGKTILSNVIVSSLKEHKKYGGIIPEIASRRQLECINSIVEKSLSEANLNLSKINAIAVTTSPGLIGSLLVGISFARALSLAANKPLVEVDHIKAHLYASFLSLKAKTPLPRLPAIGLVVSGGHTSLYQIKNFNNFKLLGETLDDAAGEAYDKVARMLGLGYPGGPVIDRLAKKQKNNSSLKFKCAELPNTLNFSFSGIKTAVFYYKRKHDHLSQSQIIEAVSAFQKSVVSILVKKSINACIKSKIKTLVIGGGVAANSELRRRLSEEAIKNGIKIYFPDMSLCMDNAAMVAGLGYHLLK